MPFFKSTYNILTKQDEDEVFNKNWMDSDKLVLPPKKDWDYSRELKIKDVNIWEVLYEASGGIGLYAAWDPYAEFFLLTTGLDMKNAPRNINGFYYYNRNIETYYGPTAENQVIQRANQLNIPLNFHKHWVENNDMWKYIPNKDEKKIILV